MPPQNEHSLNNVFRISLVVLCCQFVLQRAASFGALADGSVAVAAAAAAPNSLPLEPQRAPLASVSPPPPPVQNQNQAELIAYETWRKNPMFQASFEPQVNSMPPEQLQYLRDSAAKDLVFYKKILDDAVESRNKLGPSTRLVAKHGLRLLSLMITRRTEEKRISPRIEAPPEFFIMIASLIERILDTSKELKKRLSKKDVDVSRFRQRTVDVFDYLERFFNVSPVGLYVRLNETRLFMDQAGSDRHGKQLADEASDLVAQFRTIGYESAIGWSKKVISLIKGFASGRQPLRAEEVSE